MYVLFHRRYLIIIKLTREYWKFKTLNIPAGASEDKDEEEAEDVDGWTLDDDEEGDGGVSIFKLNGRYLLLWLGDFVWLDSPTSTFFSGEVFLLEDKVDIPTSSDVSEPVELEHFCSFSFIINSLTTGNYEKNILICK